MKLILHLIFYIILFIDLYDYMLIPLRFIFIVLCLLVEALTDNTTQISSTTFQQFIKENDARYCTHTTFPDIITVESSQRMGQNNFDIIIKTVKIENICVKCFPYFCQKKQNNGKTAIKCSIFNKNKQIQKLQKFSQIRKQYQFRNTSLKNQKMNIEKTQNVMKFCSQFQLIWEYKNFKMRQLLFQNNNFLLKLDQNIPNKLIADFSLLSTTKNNKLNLQQERRVLLFEQYQNNTRLNQLMDCQQTCRQCNHKGNCVTCRVGFYKNQNQKCQPTNLFIFLNTFMSLSLSTFGCNFLLQTFINQFSFYQYHVLSFGRLKDIFQFVGNVNRQKYQPFSFSIFQQLHTYVNMKIVGIIDFQDYLQTEQNFVKNERLPIHFISNTFKIIVWNILVILLIFSIFKCSNVVIKKYERSWQFLDRNCSGQFVAVLIFQSQTQYYSFMFCKQIMILSCGNINYKFNIIYCIIIFFFILIFALTGYAIFCFMSSQKTLKLFYPNVKNQYTFMAQLHKFVDGSGKYLVIGAIQSINDHCAVKMLLLCIWNIISMMFCYQLNIQPNSIYKFLSRNMFMFVNLVFCILGLMHHLQIEQYRQFYFDCMHVCLVLQWMIMGMEILCYLMKGLGWFVNGCMHCWESLTKISPKQQNMTKIKIKFGLKLKSTKVKVDNIS